VCLLIDNINVFQNARRQNAIVIMFIVIYAMYRACNCQWMPLSSTDQYCCLLRVAGNLPVLSICLYLRSTLNTPQHIGAGGSMVPLTLLKSNAVGLCSFTGKVNTEPSVLLLYLMKIPLQLLM